MSSVVEAVEIRTRAPGGAAGRVDVGRPASPAMALFLSLFAAQASLVVVTPILPRIAEDLSVSTPTAGLLRSASGLAAGVAALLMGPVARRFGLRGLLLAGLGGLAAGSVAGALAPTFPALVATQILVGASLAVVLSAAVAAAVAWSPEDGRSRVLSWALAGQPAAWIATLPVVGLLAGVGWRWALAAIPVTGAAAAATAVRSRPRDEPSGSAAGLGALRRQAGAGSWALGELLAYSAWTGALVFAGALFVESYGVTPAVAGLVLASGAAAYIPGNIVARRWTGPRARRTLVTLALLAGATVGLFGSVRPGLWTSAILFAGLGFLGGARTLVGSAFGLAIAPGARVAVTRVRAATLQFGYLIGTAVGGAALAAGGYPGMGIAMAALFALATVPHLTAGRRTPSVFSRMSAGRGRRRGRDRVRPAA